MQFQQFFFKPLLSTAMRTIHCADIAARSAGVRREKIKIPWGLKKGTLITAQLQFTPEVRCPRPNKQSYEYDTSSLSDSAARVCAPPDTLLAHSPSDLADPLLPTRRTCPSTQTTRDQNLGSSASL